MSGFCWAESHLIFHLLLYKAREQGACTGLPTQMVSASSWEDFQMLCQGVSGVYEETVTLADMWIFISGSHIL